MIHLKKSGQQSFHFTTKATRQAKAAELFYSQFRTATMKRGGRVIRVVGTLESLDRIIEQHVKMGYKLMS